MSAQLDRQPGEYGTLNGLSEQVGRLTPNTPEDIRKTRLFVANVALRDAWGRAETRDMLEALGLLEEDA